MNRWGILIITGLMLLFAMGYQRSKLVHSSIQYEKLEKEKKGLIEKQLLLDLDMKSMASHAFLYEYWQGNLPHLDFPGHHRPRTQGLTAEVRQR